jgi:hypothetical protein
MALQTGKSKQHSLSAAALLLAAGFALPPAYAADLGGNCCADLEERVAELEATTARKGNRRVSLTISGAVQTSVMYWDNGNNGGPAADSSDVYVVDQVPGTFVQFAGSAAINPNLSAGFQIVLAINTQSRSHQVTEVNDDAGSAEGANDISTVITVSNWYLDHKQLGRLTVGRANSATAGLTTIDLGGAGVIANANISWWNGSFGAPAGTLSWANWMGGSVGGASTARGNVVHYTSPTFAGFSVQAAAGEDNLWDAALRYAGEFSGFRLAAGIGYASNHTGTNEVVRDLPGSGNEPSQVKGSASILHVASGLYLTGAYVNQDNGDNVAIPGSRPDSTLYYLQGGIAKNWTGLGNTVLYAEYANVEDGIFSRTNGAPQAGGIDLPIGISASSDLEVWGVGVVQHIDAAAMELYLSYRNYSADLTVSAGGVTAVLVPDDMNVVLGGARIRF